jgi:hypothetical protein
MEDKITGLSRNALDFWLVENSAKLWKAHGALSERLVRSSRV